MPNYFTDNQDIQFHLDHMDLTAIIDLKEDCFEECDSCRWAPVDYEDTLDNYRRVLSVVGQVSAEYIAPRAAAVDETGARFENGCVVYAPGSLESLDQLKKAGLMGFTLPRKYGGLNIPKTVYSAAIEMVSRADASLMNLFGLQEISDTILKFGSDDQKQRYLPRFSSGEVMGAMALTEPDAGSDLQRVALKAEQKEDGNWYLNGVKRFITNGCADISLVMARSEKGISGGRGISLFIYERDPNITVRRIEHKLGIHGSPTCELQYDDAPAELLGKRKYGLIKYTMSLMNGARLGVAAQALGIAEAAYREADNYARTREQFGQPIRKFTAIYEMLATMKINIMAGRSLLYETSRVVDLKEGLEEKIERFPEMRADLKNDLKRYTRYAALLTPLVKRFNSEMANRVCDNAIQIHGGVGYTCEFPVERLYRDARITNIYEGTSQLQVVAAIGGLTQGVLFERLDEYDNDMPAGAPDVLRRSVADMRSNLEKAVAHVRNSPDPLFQEYQAARLVDMATDTLQAYLLMKEAPASADRLSAAELFVSMAGLRVANTLAVIISGNPDLHALSRKFIG